MIADDTNAIREAMRKLAQAKVQGEAEAVRKAANDHDRAKAAVPVQRPLFQEATDAPFRGFFVTPNGDIRPLKADSNFTFDQDAWDAWDEVNLESGITPETAPLFNWRRFR